MTEILINSKGSMTPETPNLETEITSIMCLNGPETFSFQLTVEKLNGKNFREGAQSIKLVIDRKGKISYLTSESK